MTRLATRFPFISPDIYNAPRAVDSDCTLVAANLTPAGSEGIRGSPIGMCMDPTQPATDIQLQAPPVGGAQTNCKGNGTVKATVPMDPNFIVPAPSSDNLGIAAVVAGSTFKYYQGAQLARCVAGGIATVGKMDGGAQSLLGTSLVGDTGASHMSIMGGVIRAGEFTNGVIPHGLQLILQSRDLYNNPTRSLTYRFPATTSDGYYHVAQKPGGMVYLGTNPKLVMGVGLCLKQSFNVGALATVPGRILAACMRDYVSFCTNTIGGSNTVCVEVSGKGVGKWDPVNLLGDVRQEFFTLYGMQFDQPHGAGNAWVADCIAIFAALQIVDSIDNGAGPNTSYGRVLAGYTASGVGSTGLGNKTGGAPIVPFSSDIGATSGGGGGGGIARTGGAVQSPNPIVAAASTVSLTKTLVVGEGIVLLVGSIDTANGRSVTAMADGTSGANKNVYTLISGSVGDQNRTHGEAWMCKNILTGGSQTIVATMSDATGAATMQAVELSGQDTVSFVERVAVAVGSSTAPDSGPTTAPSQTGEYSIGFVVYHGSTASPTAPTWGSSVTSANTETLATSTASGLGVCSYVVDGIETAAAIQEFSATIATNPWVCIVLTFLSAPATGTVLPGAPTALTVLPTSTTAITVGWTTASVVGDGILSTVITPYIAGVAQATQTLATAGTSKSMTGLTPATTYTFTAHHTNDAGAGPESAASPPATTQTTPAAPSVPVTPLIDSVGSTDIVGDWGPTSPNPGTQPITSYTLRATVVGGGSSTLLINDTNGPGGGPSLTGDFVGLTTGVPYTLAVLATNSVGSSAYSQESAIAVPSLPTGPPVQATTAYPIAAHPAISPRYASLLRGTGT